MKNFVGIDVAKAQVDLYDTGTEAHVSFENNAVGISKCVTYVASLEPQLIVLENTGGYEMELAVALQAKGLPAVVVNPRRVRDFGRAVGRLAKTDRIDAMLLAGFAATMQPPQRPVRDRQSRQMKALVSRRRQLIAMRTTEYNRREQTRDKGSLKSIAIMIKTLDGQVHEVEERLRRLVKASAVLWEKVQILTSVPGIGETTAVMLVTELPELGQLSRREVAALLGVAPINRDSGTFRGKRMTGGGRRNVRAGLFMPTLAAAHHNPVLKVFYQRLLDKGKTKMTAVIAVMRRLLAVVNSMLAKKEFWKPKTA